MIFFKKQFSWLILLALNCQAMPQYNYPAYDYDEYGDIIVPLGGPPVGTCNLPADLGGIGKKIPTGRSNLFLSIKWSTTTCSSYP